VVDAHAHVGREVRDERAEVMARAWATGLAAVVEVGCDSARAGVREHAETDPRSLRRRGVAPARARNTWSRARGDAARAVAEGGFVAIGETGLDFFRNLSPPEEQYEHFRWQLDLAREHDLPVVIHSRNADEECFEVIRGVAPEGRPLPRG
jgi:TatD DNase family protein